MFHVRISLFSQTKALENKIDLFHDKIIDVAMTFKKAIRVFLEEQRSAEYKKLSKQIKQIEHDADAIRRDIENKLYVENLLPDLRGDVLHLVEKLDKSSTNMMKLPTLFTLNARKSLRNTTCGCLNFANR